MLAHPRKICLNMIVKNEADKIENCLHAVADHISCWVIGDTGSTDGTQDIIRKFFRSRGMAGELHSFPFKTFDQARNAALELALESRLEYDYLLFVDADMELVVEDKDFARKLTADVYQIIQKSGVAYWNSRLLRRGAEARYVGVTHEYLGLKDGTTEHLDGVRFIDHASGTNRSGKFARDAALLRDGLATETDPFLRTRYTFYLANSLRDNGDHAEALEQYEARAGMGYWQEEIFVSLLNAAKIKATLNFPADDVIGTFERAAAACPSRTAEAMHDAARFCRDHGLYERGYWLARKGENAAVPKSGLFVSEWVYRYGLLDEMAIAAYWTGRHAEAVMIADKLLAMDGIPGDDVERLKSNRQLSVDKMADLQTSPDGESRAAARLLEQARRSENLGLPDEQVVAAYLGVAEVDPTCAAAFHGASRFCRYRQQHERGYHLAVRGLKAAESKTGRVDGEAWITDYGLLDELSVHAYWTGRYDEAIRACNRLLREGRIPEDMIERVANNLRFSSEGLARATRQSSQIPKTFHFIIASNDPDEPPRFSLINYLAVRSALDLNEGFKAVIHCDPEPQGPYWDMLKGSVDIVRTTLPKRVFDRPVDLIAHRVDVLRMQVLLEHGGIYLDFDTICQKPFAPLLDGSVVLGREEVPDGAGGRRPVGLCNATIIAPPGAEFLRLWYEEYRSFVGGPSGDAWNKFSVQVPQALADAHPHLVRIEPAASFFWPSWDEHGIEALFEHDLEFPEAFCFHLWQAKSSRWIESLDPETILGHDTTYNRIARRFLPRPAAADVPLDDTLAQRFGAPRALDPVFSSGKPRFNICFVGYNQHDRVYDDVVRVLRAALRDLGHDCSLTENRLAQGSVNIVVGNLLHPVQDERRVGPFRSGPFILYQLEQLDIIGHRTEGEKYLEFFDLASHVFEYSRSGLAFLRARPNFGARSNFGARPDGSAVSFLPPGFHRCLEITCPAPEQKIDVLFYGSYSERRVRVLDALRSHGLKTVHLFDVYGEPLWDTIRRSKIILNIHSTPGFRALETVRIVPLLANRCFVLSEASDDNPFGPGVAFCEIEDMAELCRAYLSVGGPLRQAVATEGYLAVRRIDFATQLRDVLTTLDLAQLVLRA
ncbi:glycosyltransferase [Methylobacterium currus]|nr:glycosyltransferase [Methylobacterium currus]